MSGDLIFLLHRNEVFGWNKIDKFQAWKKGFISWQLGKRFSKLKDSYSWRYLVIEDFFKQNYLNIPKSSKVSQKSFKFWPWFFTKPKRHKSIFMLVPTIKNPKHLTVTFLPGSFSSVFYHSTFSRLVRT